MTLTSEQLVCDHRIEAVMVDKPEVPNQRKAKSEYRQDVDDGWVQSVDKTRIRPGIRWGYGLVALDVKS